MARILITNDDGVSSQGLHAVAIALHNAGHDVLAVAPSGERSGWGAGVGTLDDGAEFSFEHSVSTIGCHSLTTLSHEL